MQPSDAPVLLYLWDKRTFYLSAFTEPLQLSQAAAMLLVGLDDELLIHSQGAALRCRSVLLPPGLELLVDSRGSRVALCYLDVFGEDFALLLLRDSSNSIISVNEDSPFLYHFSNILSM